mmetsp:Transcript_14481/g.39650  ORF Transcript_14481/g.39650 Transcript_14481/m.39650 type:complete len:208 (+) Transcript_14481:1237-1860(+)
MFQVLPSLGPRDELLEAFRVREGPADLWWVEQLCLVQYAALHDAPHARDAAPVLRQHLPGDLLVQHRARSLQVRQEGVDEGPFVGGLLRAFFFLETRRPQIHEEGAEHRQKGVSPKREILVLRDSTEFKSTPVGVFRVSKVCNVSSHLQHDSEQVTERITLDDGPTCVRDSRILCLSLLLHFTASTVDSKQQDLVRKAWDISKRKEL